MLNGYALCLEVDTCTGQRRPRYIKLRHTGSASASASRGLFADGAKNASKVRFSGIIMNLRP